MFRELWIQDIHEIRINLSVEDKCIIQGTGVMPKDWLTDSIIDAVHPILKRQYPKFGEITTMCICHKNMF